MLECKNINLRLFQEQDLDEFVALHNLCSQRGPHYPLALRSLAEYKNDFAQNGWWEQKQGRMLIVDKQDRLFGTIFFFEGDPHQEGYEIGYTIFREEDRGRGLLSEALPIFAAYIYEAQPVRRLVVVTDRENVPSQKVALKAGFKHEGTLRQSFFLRGEYRDCEIFSLIRGEHRPLKDLLQK